MIITKSKSKEEILGFINNCSNIFIIGCGSCAKQCKTGGHDDILEMKEWLKKQKKKIVGFVIPDETCHIPLLKRELRKYNDELDNSDAVLVMSCGAGTSAVREATKKRVYPASDTISLGSTVRLGDFIGRCSLCGECVLGETAGYCPITICPKSMMNGPCGGMDKGKCEVNPTEDCVWVLIHEALSVHNDLASIKKIRPAKDHSKTKRSSKIEAGKKSS